MITAGLRESAPESMREYSHTMYRFDTAISFHSQLVMSYDTMAHEGGVYMGTTLKFSSRQVLVAEDDPRLRDTISDVLEEAGYQAICASNGVEAWQKLQQHAEHIEAVVTDLSMPKMHGFSLLERIKSDPRFAAIPCIVQTGKSSMEVEAKAIRHQATQMLRKPYHPQALLAAVNAAVDANRLRKELQKQEHRYATVMGPLMRKASFRCQTVEAAREIALLLAQNTSEPPVHMTELYEQIIHALANGAGAVEIDYQADREEDKLRISIGK